MKKTPLRKAYDHLKSPTALGLAITLFFIFSAKVFYVTRDENDQEKLQNTNWLYEILEIADLKSTDLKFKLRGPKAVEAPVALITVDDESIDQIGRWPWSREKTAFVIDKALSYGAKAIALDIIFSEPQISDSVQSLNEIEAKNPALPEALKQSFEAEKLQHQPDQALADVFAKYHDKVILGTFATSEDGSPQAFQDYCRNFAFEYTGDSRIVNRLNSTFMVNDDSDNSDEFVQLKFDQALVPIFDQIKKQETEISLQGNSTFLSASEAENARSRKLKTVTNGSILAYCNRWLTDQDEYLKSPEIKNTYLDIFKNSKSLTGLPLNAAIDKFKSLIQSHPVPAKITWTPNTEALQNKSDFTASFNAEQDPDGSIRKAALFFRTGNRIGTSFVPSLAMQTYLVSTGYQSRINFGNDPMNSKQKIITQFSIYDQSKDPEVYIGEVPVDKQGRLRINYAGASNSFPFVPAKELFTSSPKMRITQRKFIPNLNSWQVVDLDVDKAEFLKDKTLIFGSIAVGVYDLRVTPFDKNFPGLETHANVLANLMTRDFLRISNSEARWMPWLLLLLGIILTLVVTESGAILGFTLTSLIMIGILVIDFILFKHGWLVTMVIPFFMVANLFVILTVYKYFTEERKKRHLRQTFSKYVSPAIVDEILKDPENVELGGKKIRMSVFFSDVRNFTSFSEKLDPQVLADVLNQYLTPMTQIVFANKGTLDKYMGDALMAFFGAPVFFEDHAACACRCALQSLVKLKELQGEFLKRGLPHIDIGIGINSADMSVGNMGSDIVRSYTVMGDAVNLGSRLESANKEYGTKILISEFTYQDVREKFTAREIDWVRVKGKSLHVRIFELICEGAPTENWKEILLHFNQGFDLFHQQQFASALDCFKKSLAANPNDECSQMYIERCENYLQHPPPTEWDGVYVMKTK